MRAFSLTWLDPSSSSFGTLPLLPSAVMMQQSRHKLRPRPMLMPLLAPVKSRLPLIMSWSGRGTLERSPTLFSKTAYFHGFHFSRTRFGMQWSWLLIHGTQKPSRCKSMKCGQTLLSRAFLSQCAPPGMMLSDPGKKRSFCIMMLLQPTLQWMQRASPMTSTLKLMLQLLFSTLLWILQLHLPCTRWPSRCCYRSWNTIQSSSPMHGTELPTVHLIYLCNTFLYWWWCLFLGSGYGTTTKNRKTGEQNTDDKKSANAKQSINAKQGTNAKQCNN